MVNMVELPDHIYGDIIQTFSYQTLNKFVQAEKIVPSTKELAFRHHSFFRPYTSKSILKYKLQQALSFRCESLFKLLIDQNMDKIKQFVTIFTDSAVLLRLCASSGLLTSLKLIEHLIHTFASSEVEREFNSKLATLYIHGIKSVSRNLVNTIHQFGVKVSENMFKDHLKHVISQRHRLQSISFQNMLNYFSASPSRLFDDYTPQLCSIYNNTPMISKLIGGASLSATQSVDCLLYAMFNGKDSCFDLILSNLDPRHCIYHQLVFYSSSIVRYFDKIIAWLDPAITTDHKLVIMDHVVKSGLYPSFYVLLKANYPTPPTTMDIALENNQWSMVYSLASKHVKPTGNVWPAVFLRDMFSVDDRVAALLIYLGFPLSDPATFAKMCLLRDRPITFLELSQIHTETCVNVLNDMPTEVVQNFFGRLFPRAI